jgi:hypothetical protein
VRGSVTGWLESILRIVRLLRRFAGLPELPHVVRFVRGLCREGGYGAKPNLRDTWLASSILSVLGEPLSSGTPAFIDRLQIPSFGFTYTADSLMGNLDVLHAVSSAARCCGGGCVIRPIVCASRSRARRRRAGSRALPMPFRTSSSPTARSRSWRASIRGCSQGFRERIRVRPDAMQFASSGRWQTSPDRRHG